MLRTEIEPTIAVLILSKIQAGIDCQTAVIVEYESLLIVFLFYCKPICCLYVFYELG
jgi:hypothetical protein